LSNVPTQGEEYSKLIHHLNEAQACAARISHLRGLQGTSPKDQASARGWLLISEQIKRFANEVTKLAMSKLQ
jgi:ribosomal protein S15P/S13E